MFVFFIFFSLIEVFLFMMYPGCYNYVGSIPFAYVLNVCESSFVGALMG